MYWNSSVSVTYCAKMKKIANSWPLIWVWTPSPFRAPYAPNQVTCIILQKILSRFFFLSELLYHATTTTKVLFEWCFFGKKFCCDPKEIFHLVGRAEKITFLPFNDDQKVEFWPFLACCAQHCSHSRASALVPLASLESSDPFYAGDSTWKSLRGPGGTIQEHLL